MPAFTRDTFESLQKEIFRLQGAVQHNAVSALETGLGPVCNAFPGNKFPIGAVHEFIVSNSSGAAVTNGFISGIIHSLMRTTGVITWITPSLTVFPPGLIKYGIDPSRVLFIHSKKEKDIAWLIEESLKCDGLSAVVGEVNDLSFTTSRRLQLAVEQSRVTGFIIRPASPRLSTTASIARWQIMPAKSLIEERLPGIGLPGWDVQLLRARNGQPGKWKLYWNNLSFYYPVEEQQQVQWSQTA